ncbi:MAG: hypothetical protein ABSE20_28645 [Acetobacteraceae bacterium]|jgi:hypothetical protein
MESELVGSAGLEAGGHLAGSGVAQCAREWKSAFQAELALVSSV